MDLILRTFFVDRNVVLRLSERAVHQKTSVEDLIRTYVEEYVSANSWDIDQSHIYGMELRSFYLTREQDILLGILANKFQTTKGNTFRAAIAAGLGVFNRGIK